MTWGGAPLRQPIGIGGVGQISREKLTFWAKALAVGGGGLPVRDEPWIIGGELNHGLH